MKEWLSPKKDPYELPTGKRYEISNDEFSKQRIDVLKNFRIDFERELGIPISFSIFGSLSKGKKLTKETAKRADIDLWIELDRETLPSDKKEQRTIARNVRKQFIRELMDKKETLGFEKIDTEHLKVRILDERTITEAVNKMLDLRFPKLTGKFIAIYIASLFTLSIGEPVKKYRNLFLAQLAGMPDQTKAEIIWQTLQSTIENIERKGKPIPEAIKKQFPETLSEALKFYGVKSVL